MSWGKHHRGTDSQLASRLDLLAGRLESGIPDLTMAIKWTVSHPQRLVVVVAIDEVTGADLLRCADEVMTAGLSSYRKLLDLTRMTRELPQGDAGLAAMGQGQEPIAFVAESDAIAASVTIQAAADRPVQIFRDFYLARIWLDSTASVSGVPEVPHRPAT